LTCGSWLALSHTPAAGGLGPRPPKHAARTRFVAGRALPCQIEGRAPRGPRFDGCGARALYAALCSASNELRSFSSRPREAPSGRRGIGRRSGLC
jgi:hypothetical protein